MKAEHLAQRQIGRGKRTGIKSLQQLAGVPEHSRVDLAANGGTEFAGITSHGFCHVFHWPVGAGGNGLEVGSCRGGGWMSPNALLRETLEHLGRTHVGIEDDGGLEHNSS
jgi:hypothetical protein